jgi:hypothetical protein
MEINSFIEKIEVQLVEVGGLLVGCPGLVGSLCIWLTLTNIVLPAQGAAFAVANGRLSPTRLRPPACPEDLT